MLSWPFCVPPSVTMELPMLKINASYSKKVPAEGEYSSQSYHCAIESELPDGLTQQQLQTRIQTTFALVKQAVETELHGAQAFRTAVPVSAAEPEVQQPMQNQHVSVPQAPPVPGGIPQPADHQQRAKQASVRTAASSKQVTYLLSLAKRVGWSVQDIISHCQVDRVEDIDRRICSQLIEKFSGRAA